MSIATPFADDPRLGELLRVSERLTGPDQPYEVVDEDVLGERLPVYRRRPSSLRDVLVNGASHGERDCYVFGDGRRISFADLVRQVAEVAAGLRDRHGVRPATGWPCARRTAPSGSSCSGPPRASTPCSSR